MESMAPEIITLCFQQNEEAQTTSTENRSQNIRALRIQEHLESEIIFNSSKLKPNLDVLSSTLGMSKSSLQRNFKAQFCQTIFDYVRTRKLDNARNYLQQKNSSLGEAAYRAGYKYGPNFSKAFKLEFGVTPGEYSREFY